MLKQGCSTQKLIRRMKEQKTTTVAQSLRILLLKFCHAIYQIWRRWETQAKQSH